MAPRGIRRKAADSYHLPNFGDYSPNLFLRLHKQKETKIWKCAFEPSITNPGETTNILATCGGKTVCLVDVTTQQVLKRYVDPAKDENFYTLAWTTLEVPGPEKRNVLAVAGEGAAIKLIDVSQLLMYAIIPGHKKYIRCLLFHPTLTRLLFSGSKDGFVYLWDIGVPDKAPNNQYVPLLKISLQDTVGDALNLIFSEQSKLLVSAGEKGCAGWVVSDCHTLIPRRRTPVLEKPDVVFQHPKSKTHMTIDGLINLPNDRIATKQVGSGEILIWDLADHVAKEKKEVTIKPLMRLNYPVHNIKYLNLGFSNGVLGVGDNNGKIYLYQVNEILEKIRLQDEHFWKPSTVLQWPNIINQQPGESQRQDVAVNTVALSSCLGYVAAGTDNNLVCIWTRNSEDNPAALMEDEEGAEKFHAS